VSGMGLVPLGRASGMQLRRRVRRVGATTRGAADNWRGTICGDAAGSSPSQGELTARGRSTHHASANGQRLHDHGWLIVIRVAKGAW
jgi:hypothetical protein